MKTLVTRSLVCLRGKLATSQTPRAFGENPPLHSVRSGKPQPPTPIQATPCVCRLLQDALSQLPLRSSFALNIFPDA